MTRSQAAASILVIAIAVPLLAQRFDNVVRADFFAGYRGDQARLARGMDTCEKALAADPNDASALVWHGGGLFFLSGRKFRDGDWKAGTEMQQRGLQEMDRAVALQPDGLATLVPRGATLIASAPFFPDEASARPLLLTAIGDYEKVDRLQDPAARRAIHSRGELYGGLAVGYRLLGDHDTAAKYLNRIVAELPGTPVRGTGERVARPPRAGEEDGSFLPRLS